MGRGLFLAWSEPYLLFGPRGEEGLPLRFLLRHHQRPSEAMVSSELRRAGAEAAVLALHRDGSKGQGVVEAAGVQGSLLPRRGDEQGGILQGSAGRGEGREALPTSAAGSRAF